MNSISIQACGIGACSVGSAAMSVNLTMTRDQQAAAVREILGTFTSDALVAFLVSEYGELVREVEA